MFVVIKPPLNDYGHEVDEELQLRCHLCQVPFKSLEGAYLAYAAPDVDQRAEPVWVHRGCAERRQLFGGERRLWRADCAIRRLLERFVVARVITLARRDVHDQPRRPWGDP